MMQAATQRSRRLRYRGRRSPLAAAHPGSLAGTWPSPRRRGPAATQGFSLLEMAIYIAVMVILGAPILAAVLTSSRATKENDTFAKVEERNRAVLNRLERDIRTSVSGTHSVSNSGRTLSFTSAAGFDGTNIINGPVVTYTLQASSGETLNNADDDGDQLIDEGDLVRTSNATSVTISGGLNMNASSFAISGSGVVLSITTFGSLDRRFGTYSSVKSVTVYPRN